MLFSLLKYTAETVERPQITLLIDLKRENLKFYSFGGKLKALF